MILKNNLQFLIVAAATDLDLQLYAAAIELASETSIAVLESNTVCMAARAFQMQKP